MPNLLKNIANAGVNMGLKIYLNNLKEVKSAGEVLEIDLKDGEAYSKISLKGEKEPVSISFKYTIHGNTLCVSDVKTSKEWLNGLAGIFKDQLAQIDISKYKAAAKIAGFLL
jgi:hypothetical protein